jgi:hypothetical protein
MRQEREAEREAQLALQAEAAARAAEGQELPAGEGLIAELAEALVKVEKETMGLGGGGFGGLDDAGGDEASPEQAEEGSAPSETDDEET